MTAGSSSSAAAKSRDKLRSSRKSIFKARRRRSSDLAKRMISLKMSDESIPEDSVIPRTSPMLMESDVDSMANRRSSSLMDCPSNKNTSNKPPGIRPRRKLLRGQITGPVPVNLENEPPYTLDVLNGCATLAIQNHSIRNLEDWHHWRILKIVKAFNIGASGVIYYLTFEAEKTNENGHCVQHTFEAHVWDGRSERRVNGIRTINPPSNWYPGNLWIPLTRPPQLRELSHHPWSPAVLERLRTTGKEDLPRRSSRLEEYNQLVPPKIHCGDPRNFYNKQSNELAKKSSENNNQSKDISKKIDEEDIITLESEPVKLHLGKLSDSDFQILKDCATLAMQDHLIQTLNLDWRYWCVRKIEKALKSCPGDGGCNYFITFQAENGDHVRTLDAEVWDDISQRRVKGFMTLKPLIIEWYPGKLWIPL